MGCLNPACSNMTGCFSQRLYDYCATLYLADEMLCSSKCSPWGRSKLRAAEVAPHPPSFLPQVWNWLSGVTLAMSCTHVAQLRAWLPFLIPQSCGKTQVKGGKQYEILKWPPQKSVNNNPPPPAPHVLMTQGTSQVEHCPLNVKLAPTMSVR